MSRSHSEAIWQGDQKVKAIFAHDHRYIRLREEVKSECQFEANVWQRYLVHFDTITVAAREGQIPAGKTAEGLVLSSCAKVSFELFSNLSSLRGLTLERRRASQRMRRLLAEHDAVIARLPSEIGLLAIHAARREGKPWAVEIAGCPWDGMWNYGSLTGKAYAPLAYWRMRKALKATDHAIYVTRSFLQARYPTQAANSEWASNVMLPAIPENALTKRLEQIDTLGERPLRLGLIGALHGRFKGIQTAITALARTRHSLPPISLHILGGGDPAPWREEAAKAGVGDIIHFEGVLPGGEPVLNWLDDIDLYLQPSLKEGLPRALIEAMSRACPALAARTAGIPELLPAGDLFPPGNANQLAALIQKRVTDHRWMAERARLNWTEAQAYRATELEARRNRFWSTFATETQQTTRAKP